MKTYSVKQVSELSGVTARTLHHYDKIGLLKPKTRSETGYRFYGESELLRLQQILFYKELDFSLKAIAEVLDDPDFDLIKALEDHKLALKSRRKRISTLLATIDHTIINLKKGKTMSSPEKLYEGLPKEMGTTYRKEAMEAYGKETIEKTENHLLEMGETDYKALRTAFEQLNTDLFASKKLDPKSAAVQRLIAKHYLLIRAFWGTSDLKDKQLEAYAGLGRLYVNDERFTMREEKPQPEFAKFLQLAMEHFAQSN